MDSGPFHPFPISKTEHASKWNEGRIPIPGTPSLHPLFVIVSTSSGQGGISVCCGKLEDRKGCGRHLHPPESLISPPPKSDLPFLGGRRSHPLERYRDIVSVGEGFGFTWSVGWAVRGSEAVCVEECRRRRRSLGAPWLWRTSTAAPSLPISPSLPLPACTSFHSLNPCTRCGFFACWISIWLASCCLSNSYGFCSLDLFLSCIRFWCRK